MQTGHSRALPPPSLGCPPGCCAGEEEAAAAGEQVPGKGGICTVARGALLRLMEQASRLRGTYSFSTLQSHAAART